MTDDEKRDQRQRRAAARKDEMNARKYGHTPTTAADLARVLPPRDLAAEAAFLEEDIQDKLNERVSYWQQRALEAESERDTARADLAALVHKRNEAGEEAAIAEAAIDAIAETLWAYMHIGVRRKEYEEWLSTKRPDMSSIDPARSRLVSEEK